MTTMPFIPEFTEYKARNKWIFDNADYFTIYRRKGRSVEKEQYPSFDEAVARAQQLIQRHPDMRYLVYAIVGIHDALVATVSSDGIKRHE